MSPSFVLHLTIFTCIVFSMLTDYEIYRERLLKNSQWNQTCLESTYKGRSQSGYALVKINKTTIGAHRLSWLIHHGKIPQGMWVLHKCDNPLCINVEHLWLGYPKDNTRDMITKNRDNFHGKRKYSQQIVAKALELRSKNMTYKRIGQVLNLSTTSINNFFRRTSSTETVKDFYGKPKYSQEIIDSACEMRRNGIACKEIQKILNIPKRTLTRIFNKHYK